MWRAERNTIWRWPALGLAMLLTALIALEATARDGDDPEEQLKRIEDEIREREERVQGLDSDVSDASVQVEEIRQELIEAAAQIQDREAQLFEAERDIAELDHRYAERQASFEKHRAELQQTLAALAMFARSPPQALIARPGDWGDTVRGLKLLDNAIPALRESADAAAAEAAALAALRDARARRQNELAENRAQLDQMHADLRQLLERKSSYYASLVAARRRNAEVIVALGEKATDTRDLINRIEMAAEEEAARRADEAAALAAETAAAESDEMVIAAAPPPDAPIEPPADESVAERPPSPTSADIAEPDVAPTEEARLSNVTPDLAETPIETASPPVADAPEAQPTEPANAADDQTEPEQVADAAPPPLEAPVEPDAARPETAPAPDLSAPDAAAPDSVVADATRLANTDPASSDSAVETSGSVPAAAPTVDLTDAEPADVAPEDEVRIRLAALPVAPPIQSSLPYPAHGDVITAFGSQGDNGRSSLGASMRTRERAQVVAPRPGEVVFAGPFRGYGNLLILKHDGEYHSLLSGFSRIDAQIGQKVLAGEPVGVMGMVAESATILYIEIRHEHQPIDPIPWLMEGDRKVSG